jgi:2-haloacid dehalogenase
MFAGGFLHLGIGRSMTKITTVVFDVGKVLFEWDLRHLFAKLIKDGDERDWFLANVVTVPWHFQVDAGRSLAEITAERKMLYPQYVALIDAYAVRFNETIPHAIPGTLEIIAELSARKTPLFAITNFGAEFWATFRPTQPIFDHFQDIIVSGVEKIVKPDPAIYALALRRFNLKPDEALFIDDNRDNIVSARANGFAGHHFTDAITLRIELAAMGLLG